MTEEQEQVLADLEEIIRHDDRQTTRTTVCPKSSILVMKSHKTIYATLASHVHPD